MIRPWFTWMAACAVANAFQPSNSTIDAERKSDVYAIYSLMMTDPKTSHGENNNVVYLIADTTVPGVPRQPCGRVPPEYQHAFDEVMADFNARKNNTATLVPAFNISHPYKLLNASDVADFIELHTLGRTPYIKNTDELLRKTPDLWRLTDVYFNGNHTLALTAISTFCGGLCGMMSWKIFEKTEDGAWKERPWVTCFGMA